jgi:rSAM/selenodomain-associated transferase 1
MSAEPDLALVVFARAPVPGRTKSRLIPCLGPEGAARLQQRMTEHVLAAACEAGIGAVSLWCAPSTRHLSFAACRAKHGVALRAQRGADLGERLLHAHDCTFASRRRLLVIGTDCPILTARELRAAAADLLCNDAVVVPAADGGYVLLGLARPCPAVFREIAWGSSEVLAQTLARLRASGLSCRVREALWDVDRAEDLERLAECLPGLLDGLVLQGERTARPCSR